MALFIIYVLTKDITRLLIMEFPLQVGQVN